MKFCFLAALLKSGLLDAEFGCRAAMTTVYPQAALHLAKPPGNRLTALEGLRLKVASKPAAAFIARWRWLAQPRCRGDLYTGLARTVIGTVISMDGVPATYKLAEVTNYRYTTALGYSVGMVFIARKRYDAVLPGARILDDNSGPKDDRHTGHLLQGRSPMRPRENAQADPRQHMVAPSAPRPRRPLQQIVVPVT